MSWSFPEDNPLMVQRKAISNSSPETASFPASFDVSGLTLKGAFLCHLVTALVCSKCPKGWKVNVLVYYTYNMVLINKRKRISGKKYYSLILYSLARNDLWCFKTDYSPKDCKSGFVLHNRSIFWMHSISLLLNTVTNISVTTCNSPLLETANINKRKWAGFSCFLCIPITYTDGRQAF